MSFQLFFLFLFVCLFLKIGQIWLPGWGWEPARNSERISPDFSQHGDMLANTVFGKIK